MGKSKTGRPIDTPIGTGLNVTGQDFERRAPVIPPGIISYIYSGEFRTSKKTANATLSTEMVVLVDAKSVAITLTLPVASSNLHKVYYIKKVDTTSNIVTIKPASTADEIDKDDKYEITTPMTCITLICDASDWWII